MADLHSRLSALEAELPLDEFEVLIRWWKAHWGRAAEYQRHAPPECMEAILNKTTDPVEALNGIVAVLSTVHPDVIDMFQRRLDGWLEVARLLRVAAEEDEAMRRTMVACAAVLSAAAVRAEPERVVHGEQDATVTVVERWVGGDRLGDRHAYTRLWRQVAKVLRQRAGGER